MDRIDREEMFIRMATLVSKRGTCPRRQVGALIVRDNRVISMGYNGAPPGMPHCTVVGCDVNPPLQVEKTLIVGGCERAVHAELNAIAFSARQGQATDDAAMYSTCATCAPCARALIAAGIVKFVYQEPYRLTEGVDLLKEAGVEVKQWTN